MSHQSGNGRRQNRPSRGHQPQFPATFGVGEEITVWFDRMYGPSGEEEVGQYLSDGTFVTPGVYLCRDGSNAKYLFEPLLGEQHEYLGSLMRNPNSRRVQVGSVLPKHPGELSSKEWVLQLPQVGVARVVEGVVRVAAGNRDQEPRPYLRDTDDSCIWIDRDFVHCVSEGDEVRVVVIEKPTTRGVAKFGRPQPTAPKPAAKPVQNKPAPRQAAVEDQTDTAAIPQPPAAPEQPESLLQVTSRFIQRRSGVQVALHYGDLQVNDRTDSVYKVLTNRGMGVVTTEGTMAEQVSANAAEIIGAQRGRLSGRDGFDEADERITAYIAAVEEAERRLLLVLAGATADGAPAEGAVTDDGTGAAKAGGKKGGQKDRSKGPKPAPQPSTRLQIPSSEEQQSAAATSATAAAAKTGFGTSLGDLLLAKRQELAAKTAGDTTGE